MAREQRGNREYYYRKQRRGQRVISEYVGGGLVADIAEARDNIRRGHAAQRRAAWQAAKRAEEQFDAILGEVDAAVEPVVTALMLATGHHTHKRQWRRKRSK